MARTSLTVRGRSLGETQFDAFPAKSNATNTSHDNLQRATVIHLGFLLNQSQQEPFVFLFLSIQVAVIRELLSITISPSSATYSDILCSWLILLIFLWSAIFLLSCSIVHLFNILRYGMGKVDTVAMLVSFLRVDKSPPFRHLL